MSRNLILSRARVLIALELLREGHRLYREMHPSKNTTASTAENTAVGIQPPSEMTLFP